MSPVSVSWRMAMMVPEYRLSVANHEVRCREVLRDVVMMIAFSK